VPGSRLSEASHEICKNEREDLVAYPTREFHAIVGFRLSSLVLFVLLSTYLNQLFH